MSDKIIRFTSATCAPCKIIAKTLESMNLDIPIEVIDISVFPEYIDEFGIRGVPTLVYQGKQLVGNKTAEEIKEFLNIF